MSRLAAVLILALAACAECLALDEVKFATNWKAQAEHGGFYQAMADGGYERAGLDVEIVQGGPLVNNRTRLVFGRVQFLMGGNLIQSFDSVKQGLPTVIVAAIFQRDGQCLIAHPDQGNDTWEDLKSARLLVGAAGKTTYHRWLQSAHGFPARGVKTYTFNLAPFLANKKLVQQGYLTAEPRAIAKAIGREPNVFPLFDYDWTTYSTTIETTRDLADENPDLVQRFVDASIRGWVRYLYGDPAPAHAAIREANPEMSLDQLEFSRRKMLQAGLVDSGDALEQGLGALNADRIAGFYRDMVDAGLYGPDELDVRRVYRTDFVNQGVGLEEKRALAGDPE